jgi:hypothetical protein
MTILKSLSTGGADLVTAKNAFVIARLREGASTAPPVFHYSDEVTMAINTDGTLALSAVE